MCIHLIPSAVLQVTCEIEYIVTCPEDFNNGEAQFSEEAFCRFCGTVEHGHIEFHGDYKIVRDIRLAAVELLCSGNAIFLHGIFKRFFFFFTWIIDIHVQYKRA